MQSNILEDFKESMPSSYSEKWWCEVSDNHVIRTWISRHVLHYKKKFIQEGLVRT